MSKGKYKQTAFNASEDSIKELKQIAEEVGTDGMSATIRYCIRQIYKQIKKQGA